MFSWSALDAGKTDGDDILDANGQPASSVVVGWIVQGCAMKAILTPHAANRAIAIVVRMCLVVSLWQAPIPWIHSHEATSSGTLTQSEVDLRVHLAVWHQEPTDHDHDLGWHLHWILPMWGHALDDTPDDEPPAEEAFAFDQVLPNASDFSVRFPVAAAFVVLPFLEMPGLVPASHPIDARTVKRGCFPGMNSVLRC